MNVKPLHVISLGPIDYQSAWDLQKALFDKRLNNHIEDALLFCEHPHTYTVGKNGVDSVSKHLRMNKDELASHGIKIFEIDRGGDITYHGPGQIVGYPILNLNNYYRDVHRYLRDIEETIIRMLAEYGLTGKRIESITGVWIDTPRGPEKICAIGVKVTRWITMHGFAFNVNTNLDFFNGIVPCGISDKGVTSLEKLLNKKIDQREAETVLTEKFAEVFGVTAQAVAKEQVLTMESPHAIVS